MDRRFRKLILAFVVLFAFFQFHCSGVMPVYRLSPVNGKPVWDYGREVIGKEDDKGKVHLSMESVKDGYFVFLINYENLGNVPVNLDPAAIYCQVFRDSIPQSPAPNTPLVYAVDPELQLAGLEKQENELKTSEKYRQGFNVIAGAIDVAVTVSNIGKKRSDEEIKKEERERTERRIADENAKIDYENNVAQIGNAKEYWANDMLRKVTIFPGEKAGGFFHLPIKRKTDYVRITIPIDDHTYFFDYRQYEVKGL